MSAQASNTGSILTFNITESSEVNRATFESLLASKSISDMVFARLYRVLEEGSTDAVGKEGKWKLHFDDVLIEKSSDCTFKTTIGKRRKGDPDRILLIPESNGTSNLTARLQTNSEPFEILSLEMGHQDETTDTYLSEARRGTRLLRRSLEKASRVDPVPVKVWLNCF